MYKGVDCSSFSILNHDFTFFHIIRINILLEPYDVSEHFYIINLLLFFIKIAPFKLIVLFLSKKKLIVLFMISSLIICLNGLIRCFIFLIFEFYRTQVVKITSFFFFIYSKWNIISKMSIGCDIPIIWVLECKFWRLDNSKTHILEEEKCDILLII